MKLQQYKNQWEQEVKSFGEKLEREIIIPIQKITQDLMQEYERKEDLYEILIQTKSLMNNSQIKQVKCFRKRKQEIASNIFQTRRINNNLGSELSQGL